MQLLLHLNARFQPKHRFELEDALQEIFQKNKAGEITGGGTSLKENCDINYVIEQLEQVIDGIGRMYSYRELNEFTALYFYGTSFLVMKEKMDSFISSYPLCQKCQIEQIAQLWKKLRVHDSVHTFENDTDEIAEFVVFRFVPDGINKRELIKADKTVVKR